MRTIFIAMLAILAAAFFDGVAFAHPQLQAAEPAAGSVTTPPKQIRITFNEGVIPKFSGIAIKDKTGRTVAVGKAAIDPGDKKRLVVPVLEDMAAGEYRVDWYAVSDDTHRIKGTYSFGVSHR
ncbi:MAG: copper homeostasis periplasmic binding protein CopC [Rhizobiales bacterium]|mgnify:CR=1 FL=1|nr:copper homeostasis periplasmic binding protein CopC [Hyphomicrobiales bacterium]